MTTASEVSFGRGRWQIDSTNLNVLITDTTGAVVRPWLTIVIGSSREVVAFRLTVTAPDDNLLQSLLSELTDQGKLTTSGRPVEIFVDNGPAFVKLKKMSQKYWPFVFKSPLQGRYEDRVERVFQRINKELSSFAEGTQRFTMDLERLRKIIEDILRTN